MLFTLAFASAPYLKYLTLPHAITRRTVLQKVRGPTVNSCSTACKHRVSGSLSLPSRGPFHLSFTVLCAIGHWVVFSLTEWSPLIPTRFHVSRGTLDQNLIIIIFTYRTITSYGLTFQLCSVNHDFSLMFCPQPQG